jgi:hypothetical protein
MRLAQILELLETVVLLTGFDNPSAMCIKWIDWSAGTAGV